MELSTAAVADACVLEGVPLRRAPAAVVPLVAPAPRVSGPAIPVVHRGSVDVFLEAIADAERVHARADAIEATERGQADRARAGTPLREQLQLERFLAAREQDPTSRSAATSARSTARSRPDSCSA